MSPGLQEWSLKCGKNTICSLLFTVPIMVPQGAMCPVPNSWIMQGRWALTLLDCELGHRYLTPPKPTGWHYICIYIYTPLCLPQHLSVPSGPTEPDSKHLPTSWPKSPAESARTSHFTIAANIPQRAVCVPIIVPLSVLVEKLAPLYNIVIQTAALAMVKNKLE